VTTRAKLLERILAGTSDQAIDFEGLVNLLQYLGFRSRVAGSHHVFSRDGIVEILNLQPRRDGTAKPYQVKQVRLVITRYKLIGDADAR
jgi:predicted RNA binding protein YcfA (HicA-like mRNA interferase family)